VKTTLIFCALATSVFGEPPILPRITPDELATLQQSPSPMTCLEKPAANEAAVARPNGQSIIKQSVILHDGNNWTLVPKGAVVFLPESMKNRVAAKPVGTLLPFTDFLARNHAWITTDEVSIHQAAGTEPLPSGRVAFWTRQGKVVVSVHQGGPISMPAAKESSPLTQR